MSFKIWQVSEEQPERVVALSDDLGVPSPIAQAMVNRGYDSVEKAREFIDPQLNNLRDPFILPNMELGVRRIQEALDKGQSIVVHGDYDVDGISSTALFVSVLRQLGADVHGFIPHRIDDGYGLTEDTVKQCVERHKPSLIITVDCGTGSVDAVAFASTLGVDTVVTDHHEAGEGLAPALAIVNPKLVDDGDFERNLAGVGVAFKVCHALVKFGRSQKFPPAFEIDLRQWLYLVAMGTVADMVPLEDENRTLSRMGIRQLNETPSLGIDELVKVIGIRGSLSSYHIGFMIGPRINAAGRLADPTAALDLLLSEDYQEASELAHLLDSTNRERQEVERDIFDRAVAQVDGQGAVENRFALVVAGEGWHPGVVGIVASRLVQKYYRPAIVMGLDEEGVAKGSCRSVEGFDLVAHLQRCEAYLSRFGGHKMAAGVEVKANEIEPFRAAFEKVAGETLKDRDLRPVQKIDAWVSLDTLSHDFVEWIERMEPFGLGNARPVWAVRGVKLAGDKRIVGVNHVRCRFTDGYLVHDAIAFNAASKDWPDGAIDVAFQLQINRFHNKETLQMVVQDFRPTEAS